MISMITTLLFVLATGSMSLQTYTSERSNWWLIVELGFLLWFSLVLYAEYLKHTGKI